MDVTATKTIRNNIYYVRFDIKFTDEDNRLINKFGDPDVNYGGEIDFINDIEEPDDFTIPNNYRKLRAGTGWTQSFDGSVLDQAELMAIGYEATIRARIAVAVSQLRANEDNFTQVNTQTV